MVGLDLLIQLVIAVEIAVAVFLGITPCGHTSLLARFDDIAAAVICLIGYEVTVGIGGFTTIIILHTFAGRCNRFAITVTGRCAVGFRSGGLGLSPHLVVVAGALEYGETTDKEWVGGHYEQQMANEKNKKNRRSQY